MTRTFRFPRCAHLRVAAEFQAVFGEGSRVSSAHFRLHARLVPDAGATVGTTLEKPARGRDRTRLGVTVSKRVDKRAVGRNRIRRQVRETFRCARAGLPAGDYVLLAKPDAARCDNAALRAELLALFDRARTLKPMPAIVTMPSSDAIPGRPLSET